MKMPIFCTILLADQASRGGILRNLAFSNRNRSDSPYDVWRQERGFTLLELLVVLAILGLLIGLVAPAALRQLGSAKEKIAHQSIERLASVLDIYKLDVGNLSDNRAGTGGAGGPPIRR